MLLNQWLAVYSSGLFQLLLCCGPLATAATVILLYYILRFRHPAAPPSNEKWGTLSWIILALPIPLFVLYNLTNTIVVLPYQRARSATEAEAFRVALEAFHERTGYYPRNLAELVPHELQQVPSTFGAVPFRYSTDGDFYSISYQLFNGRPIDHCDYASVLPEDGWQCFGIGNPD